MTDRELMQQAADVLQAVRDTPASKDEIQRAWIVSDLLKRRLAQPEQEPMHNVQSNGRHSPLLTHMMNKQTTPPQPEHHELQAKGEHPAPCARHCEATAFQIVIKNLKAQLAQPEQEPVAWVTGWHGGHCVIRAVDPAAILQIGTALYTTPPQRKPLTDEEIDALVIDKDGLPNSHLEFARAIEAKLKEKNT